MTIVCCKDRDGVDFFYVDDKAGAGYIEIGRPAPRKILERVDIVFVTTSEPQFMEDVILTASQLGKEVMVDIGSYGITPRFLQKIIPLAKIIFGNEAEIKQVCGAFEARKIEDIFELTGTCFPEVIILEDKFNGSISLYTREEVTRVGPIPLRKTGSSTGCCDGMAAGFLFFYQHGLNLDLCAKAGLVLCSTIWEVEGVQEGMPTPQEFYDRFVAYFGSEYSSAQLNEIKRLLDHRAPHNF
jgi:sugar/nucleoside kinase (ribokinase family)